MKKFAKSLFVLFAAILAVSAFAFAEDAEEEKKYIVYPKKEVTLFSARGETPEYMVIGEEELNMLLEEGLVESYRETIKGVLLGDAEEENAYNFDNWDIEEVKAFEAHKQGYTGKGIRVGVIDSGIDCGHHSFSELVLVEGQLYLGGCRVEDGYNYMNNSNATKDTFGHGTAVAGKIGAYIQPHYYDNQGKLITNWGISGTAPAVTLVPLKVTNTETGIDETYVIDAIKGAVDDYDCDIINISIGFYEDFPEMKAAIDYAVGKGVTVVAAVGNDRSDQLIYPAAYDNVIGVGATDKDGNVWVDVDAGAGSQQNESVFITAPGAGVVTTWSYDAPVIENDQTVVDENGNPKKFNFVRTEGTSVSAPLVTGTVALLKQANPYLTPAEIMSILAESAGDAGDQGYDFAYGHGILNVEEALKRALDETRAPSTVTYRVTAEDEALSGAITVDNYIPGNIGSHPLGTSFTAKAEPTVEIENDTYKFAYWANGNGTYVSGETPYTFIATSNFTLRAVYDKVTDNESATTEKKVEFWNGNGILLDTADVDTTTGKVASIPEKAQSPTMTGYAFDGWLDEDKKEFTAESVLEKNLTRVVAQFTDATTQYNITFDDNTNEDITQTGKYGDTVEYSATGDGFDYWKLGDEIISYDSKINIALWGAKKELTAVYNEENVTPKPTVVLDEGADGADFLIYSVPDDYTIIDAGIVFGKEGSTPRVASFHSKASVKKLPKNGFGQFTSLPGDESHEVARGYLIYKDPDDVTRVIYAD